MPLSKCNDFHDYLPYMTADMHTYYRIEEVSRAARISALGASPAMPALDAARRHATASFPKIFHASFRKATSDMRLSLDTPLILPREPPHDRTPGVIEAAAM